MDQVVVCGPLGEHVAGLRAELTRTGYTESSSRDIVRAMARLSSWLEDNGLMPSELTPQVVDEFLLLRREYSSVEGVARRGLGPALRFLRDIGVVPSRDEVADGTPIEVLLSGYRGWLADERALAAESVRCYCCQARTFLRWLPEPLDEALAHLDAPTVTTFIVEQSAVAGSVWSAKALVTSVRSLLRFPHVRGLISVPLTAAVPAVAGWRLSGLPRALDAGHVDALLAGCDITVPVGLRDHTILIMLARLGLRGAEVAALGLDDVDWRSGEIVVRGKGSRVERLPLAVEVGTAMATYLTRGRAHCDCPTLFVTARAPYQALSGSTIRAIMGRACQRAGLPRLGAHRLRHSLATDLPPVRGIAHRNRTSAATPQPTQHRCLCKGRPQRTAPAGTALAGEHTMTTLRIRAEEYLAMRRRLGFKLTTFGTKLMSFIDYLDAVGATTITTDSAVAWATGTRRSTDEVYWSRRLMVIRIFARHLKVLDPETEIPPEDILSHHYRRVVPHLYTSGELAALLDAADMLRPTLRAWTWRTLLSLLAVTGMRVGEACHLDRGDVDLLDGVLTIRDSKFGKSRHVPIHTTTTAALRRYGLQRDWWCPTSGTPAFFVSTHGTRLDKHNLSHTFIGLLETAAIATQEGRRRPRLHDLRHSFATATLLDWYRDGEDVAARLPQLSTYLGHADPKSTYWYLTGSPELLALAAARLEQAFGGQQ